MTRLFSPAQSGTPEATWRSGPLDLLPALAAPGRGDRLVVAAAHPDDETLGAGGLIAVAVARGATVCVVIASDGEASHPDSPTHSPRQLSPLRRTEVTQAIAALGAGVELQFLGLPDGGLTEHLTTLVERLAPHLANATHVVSTWSNDGHPDHQACSAACAELVDARAQHWQFPIWAWHWADPSADRSMWAGAHRLDLSPAARRAKRDAVGRYLSQIGPLSPEPGDEAVLPPHVLAHFDRDFETFVVAAPAASGTYFDRLYASAPDPWGLGERFYEQRKRDLVLAALPRARFARCFEPGCATGQLTALLTARCDEVVAWDGATAAVLATRARCPGANLTAARKRIPSAWPDGTFDLIVLSEVAYYCVDLDDLVARIRASVSADAVVVACHWRHPAADHPHTGDTVHAALDAGLGLHRLATHVETDFRLDVWSTQNRSVAQREGLVT